MKYDFNELASKYEQGDRDSYYKFEEGANRFRVLSDSPALREHFKFGVCIGSTKGCPQCKVDDGSVKFMTWILDYRDNTIKTLKMPWTILNAIGGLQKDPDYAFDEVPMPYDITVNAKNAGKKEVDYTVLPARNNTPIDQAILDEFAKKTPIETIIEKMKEKQAKKLGIVREGKTDYDENSGSQEVKTVSVDQSYPTPESEGIDLEKMADLF